MRRIADLAQAGAGVILERLPEDVPGLGRLFVSSIINRDFTLILGTTLVYAAALLVLNLVADLAKAALDPRVARGGDR